MPKIINLVIIQQIFPPFRDAFFTKLDRVKEINLSVICGKPHKSKARESFENHDVIKVKFIRNFFCGPTGNFTYQHGALSRILEENPDVIIIEFDLRVATLWVLFFLRLFMPFKLVLWGHGFGPRSSKTIKWIRVFLAKKSDAMILYGENAALEFYNAGVQKNKINVAIATWEWPSYFSKEDRMKGISLQSAIWKRPAPDTIPTDAKAAGLYMICTLSKHEAEAKGFTDSLMLDHEGNIAEATGANIFFKNKTGELHTPIPDSFLDGITRREVIKIAKSKKK